MFWHREAHINPRRNRQIIVHPAGTKLTTSGLRQHHQLSVVQHDCFMQLKLCQQHSPYDVPEAALDNWRPVWKDYLNIVGLGSRQRIPVEDVNMCSNLTRITGQLTFPCFSMYLNLPTLFTIAPSLLDRHNIVPMQVNTIFSWQPQVHDRSVYDLSPDVHMINSPNCNIYIYICVCVCVRVWVITQSHPYDYGTIAWCSRQKQPWKSFYAVLDFVPFIIP